MSVADHHVVPGKKFWTWGNGPRGRMWDKILTDEDGPYIELMVGAYSDNQPDYSWLQPYETKSFSMYWYPFRDIGGVKKANLDAAVNLDVNERHGQGGLLHHLGASRGDRDAQGRRARCCLQEKVAIDPGKPYVKQVSVAGRHRRARSASPRFRRTARNWSPTRPIRLEPEPMPKPVEPPPRAAGDQDERGTVPDRPADRAVPRPHPGSRAYWEEALRRDPGDVRVNTALGINYFKKAASPRPRSYFRKALERLTDKYTTPEGRRADLLSRAWR